MPRLGEGEIIEAMDQRRSFATEDLNAQVMTVVESGGRKNLMGTSIQTAVPALRYYVGYEDPDGGDKHAFIRIHFFTQQDDLNFIRPNIKITRLAKFSGSEVFPPQPLTDKDKSETDSSLTREEEADYFRNTTLPIESGEVMALDMHLAPGNQYFFVEIIQKLDSDRLWSAPHWVANTGVQ
jgi:hypothetical protein